MQRLVYQPRVQAYIMLEDKQRMIDVTEDIVAGSVNRRLNALSTASLTLQNKHRRYTDPNSSNRIQPMDRIAIRLGRIGPMMLSFTGYIDEAPYYQLYPGTVEIQASCTLKLVQNTYFDPGLPYMTVFMEQFGFTYNPATGQLQPSTANVDGTGTLGTYDVSGSIADLIYVTLNEIGGWPLDAIEIYNLPAKFLTNLSTMMKQAQVENDAEYQKVLNNIKTMLNGNKTKSIGVGDGGSGSTNTGVYTNPPSGNVTIEDAARLAMKAGFNGNDAITAVAIACAESSLVSDNVNYNPDGAGTYDGTYDLGLWQINSYNIDTTLHHLPAPPSGATYGNKINNLTSSQQTTCRTMFDPWRNVQQAYSLFKSGGFGQWSTYNNGAYKSHMSDAQTAVQRAALTPQATPVTPKTDTTGDATPTPNPSSGTNTIATRIVKLAVAEADKGIVESGSSNSGPEIQKYQAVTGAFGQPWCGSFVSWVFQQAGKPLTFIPGGSASVANIYDWGAANNAIVQTPRPGDLVCFSWDGQTIPNDHVGIVIRNNNNGTIDTVEGNTGTSGNASGGVGVKTRSIISSGVGETRFVRIPGIGLPAANADQGAGGAATVGDATGSGALGGTMTNDGVSLFQIAKNAAWYTLQLQTSDTAQALMLRGKRALANDISLMEWMNNLVQASGRVYCSAPNGSFVSFFPDRFGWFEKTPYFTITDIEIVDLTIQKNDRNLATHVFASGSQWGPGLSDLTNGIPMVASVEDHAAFAQWIGIELGNDFLIPGENLSPIEFLRKYGARPYVQSLPDLRSPILLWMAAWSKFVELWASQYQANAQFTFMPELLPGGIVEFDGRITMFVESVTHTFSREAGFSTTAELSSPAAINDLKFQGLPQAQNDQITEVSLGGDRWNQMIQNSRRFYGDGTNTLATNGTIDGEPANSG